MEKLILQKKKVEKEISETNSDLSFDYLKV